MSEPVKPIIHNIDKPIKVWLGKRLEDIAENITFECPECNHKMKFLDDTADLEYGSFHGTDECWECGVPFEEYNFQVSASITITKKER